MGAFVHSVVFINKKAWLVIKPMKKLLDVIFYHKDRIDSALIVQTTLYKNKFAHHIRIGSEYEKDITFFKLLRIGFNYAMRG